LAESFKYTGSVVPFGSNALKVIACPPSVKTCAGYKKFLFRKGRIVSVYCTVLITLPLTSNKISRRVIVS
jgi:hypothetical protein